MGHSEFDLGSEKRRPWNVGRMIGSKKALKPQQVWAIRLWLDREQRTRDRALFDLAIESKLRGCDIVKMRIGNLVSGGQFVRAQLRSKRKPAGQRSSNCSSRLGAASLPGSSDAEVRLTISCFQAGLILQII